MDIKKLKLGIEQAQNVCNEMNKCANKFILQNAIDEMNKALSIAGVGGTKVFPCKKIKAGKYKYRGWIISCVGYYEPERRVCWEAIDPETTCGDFHGYSKKEIKRLIDDYLS